MTFVRVDVDFDALAHLVHDGIAFVGSDERVVAWSDRAATVTGIVGPQALGKTLGELFGRVEPPLEFAVIPQRVLLWTRDDARRCLHATILSVEGGWMISLGAQQRFAQIDHVRGEIVAAVSHELKTPIATIKAFATTLRANPIVTESARDEYLKTIEDEADRLTFAVDDLLVAARVDVEHLPERRERLSLERVMQLVFERLGYGAGGRIEYRGGNATVFVDAPLFGSALAHVIENGLKFSADSTAVVVEAMQDRDVTVVRVIDRGIGISEEHMPYIFDRFYRGDSKLTATTGGSGLGLYIARSIVLAHGGTVNVSSTQGKGTTVELTVPWRA